MAIIPTDNFKSTVNAEVTRGTGTHGKYRLPFLRSAQLGMMHKQSSQSYISSIKDEAGNYEQSRGLGHM
jgi:hypothetical protein